MTNYRQSANPDATNSELDAKKIVKNVQLTSSQRDELISQYVELVVDGMDLDSLVQYAHEQIANYVDSLSDIELKEEVGNYDEELFDELVDNVTQQYPKQLNTFEEERYIQELMKEVD